MRPEPCLSGESEDGGEAEGEDPDVRGGPESLYRFSIPGTQPSPDIERVSLKSLVIKVVIFVSLKVQLKGENKRRFFDWEI